MGKTLREKLKSLPPERQKKIALRIAELIEQEKASSDSVSP